MKAFSVRLKDPLHQTASQKAEELGVPITELVRQALDSFCTAGDALTSTTNFSVQGRQLTEARGFLSDLRTVSTMSCKKKYW